MKKIVLSLLICTLVLSLFSVATAGTISELTYDGKWEDYVIWKGSGGVFKGIIMKLPDGSFRPYPHSLKGDILLLKYGFKILDQYTDIWFLIKSLDGKQQLLMFNTTAKGFDHPIPLEPESKKSE